MCCREALASPDLVEDLEQSDALVCLVPTVPFATASLPSSLFVHTDKPHFRSQGEREKQVSIYQSEILVSFYTSILYRKLIYRESMFNMFRPMAYQLLL